MRSKDNPRKKRFGPKTTRLVRALYERNRPVFRLKEVQEILHIDGPSSRNLVRKMVNRGIAARLKPGLFILVPPELGEAREHMGSPLVVAREIAGGSPYYLSHATAMEIHGMLTQPQLVVYTTTQKQLRHVTVLGIDFRFIRSPKRLFFGLCDHWATKQERVKVSDPERTILDGLRRPEYCGGLTEIAKGLHMRRKYMNVRRLLHYALKMDTGAVVRRLGYLLEVYEMAGPDDIGILQQNLTETYVRFDPLLPAEGKFLRRWRLQLNVSVEELLSVIRT